jgi:hypothetical protein
VYWAERDGKELAVVDSQPVTSLLTAEEFVAIERAELDPWVETQDGRSTLLAEEFGLLIAGPSGLGKSLALIDLGGLLAAPRRPREGWGGGNRRVGPGPAGAGRPEAVRKQSESRT